MALSASEIAPTAIFLVLVVVLLARRVYQSVHGASINPTSLLALAGFFLLLFVVTVVEGLYLFPSLSLVDLGVDSVLIVASAWVGIRYTRRRVEIWRRPDGVWMYRMGMVIAIVYLTLFAVRLLLDLFVVGLNPFGPVGSSVTLSPAAAAALLVVDALFAVSTGLFLGRNFGVYLVYRAALLRPSPPSAPPIPPSRG
ncbi:MAG: hypothetical protein L3J87_02825 [Thermoplasmata archaeon]|nr:hypothetical protein [Thermoplasmata archaeon]